MIICYYAVMTIFLSYGLSYTDDTYTYSNPLNESELSDSEIDTGGVFGTGVSFGRFFGLVTIGIGLPDDTPTFFKTMFIAWQTVLLILSVGFLISSIWDG